MKVATKKLLFICFTALQFLGYCLFSINQRTRKIRLSPFYLSVLIIYLLWEIGGDCLLFKTILIHRHFDNIGNLLYYTAMGIFAIFISILRMTFLYNHKHLVKFFIAIKKIQVEVPYITYRLQHILIPVSVLFLAFSNIVSNAIMYKLFILYNWKEIIFVIFFWILCFIAPIMLVNIFLGFSLILISYFHFITNTFLEELSFGVKNSHGDLQNDFSNMAIFKFNNNLKKVCF